MLAFTGMWAWVGLGGLRGLGQMCFLLAGLAFELGLNCPSSPKNLDCGWGNGPKTPPGLEPTDFPSQAYETARLPIELWPS